MKSTEEWRGVRGYTGFYEVSDEGRIRRCKGGRGAVLGRVRKMPLDSWGYPTVQLSKRGSQTSFKVHRLVARAFLGQCPADLQVNHMNGIKTDNRLANLEYITQSGNRKHGYRVLGWSNVGEQNPGAKLSEKAALEILKMLDSGARQVDIAKRFGISQVAVSQIRLGKSWGHTTGRKYGTVESGKVLNRGARNPATKLTDEQILEIRNLLQRQDLSGAAIARRYDVSGSTISFIKHGQRRYGMGIA